MGKLIDETGNTYGRLTAVEHLGGHPAKWRCDCECGNKAIVRGDSLRKGLTKSCGCLQKEVAAAIAKSRAVYEGETSYEKHIHKNYGLTPEKHLAMQEAQDYSCAICGKHEDELGYKLRVDHNHDSGKVRGLLCNGCNTSLGHFGDSVDGLQKAIDYLNKTNSEKH